LSADSRGTKKHPLPLACDALPADRGSASTMVRNRSIQRKKPDTSSLSFFISKQVTFDDHRLKIKEKLP
jgi:hypothetical protein